MAKESGLNVRLYVMGYDLSGDANALDGAGYSQETMETTALASAAASRITGLADGSLSVNGYFDNATGKIHPIFTSNSGKIPTADQVVLVPMGASVGDPSVGISAKEADYNVSRSSGSAISVTSTFTGNGMGGEFGTMLTAHDDTITSSTSGTAVDDSSSSASGGSWYYQIMAFSAVGGNARWTVNLQHSTNNSSYTDVDSAHVTAVGAARGTFTGTLNRYVKHRVVLDASSGSITFAIAYMRT